MRRSAPNTTAASVTLAALAASTALTASAAGQDLRLVDDPTLGAFIDISGSGQPLDVGDDGEVELDETFPGNFVLRPGLIVVGQNGGASFGSLSVTDLAPENEPIPSRAAFLGSQSALLFWDDIDDKEGDVLADSIDGVRIVQWNVGNFEGTGDTLKFQLQIFDNPEPTGIYAQFLYVIDGSTAGAGAGATIGYQDGDTGFDDLQRSFNVAEAVTNGTVLSLMIPACPADTNFDGVVDPVDLVNVIVAWATDGAASNADVDGSGLVDVADLLAIFLAWGACPP